MKTQRCESKNYKPERRNGRREERQDEAHARHLARIDRDACDQLALLDARLGEGVGAVRERKRLHAELREEAASYLKDNGDYMGPNDPRLDIAGTPTPKRKKG